MYKTRKLISTTEAAKILGVSRVTVFQRIKRGEIEATKVGRSYAIDPKNLGDIYQEVTPAAKKKISKAVNKVFDQYGEVLRRLGKE